MLHAAQHAHTHITAVDTALCIDAVGSAARFAIPPTCCATVPLYNCAAANAAAEDVASLLPEVPFTRSTLMTNAAGQQFNCSIPVSPPGAATAVSQMVRGRGCGLVAWLLRLGIGIQRRQHVCGTCSGNVADCRTACAVCLPQPLCACRTWRAAEVLCCAGQEQQQQAYTSSCCASRRSRRM